MAQLKSTSVTGNLSVTGNVVASQFTKFGGTNNQILLADGSTKSLTDINDKFTELNNSKLALLGGTMTGRIYFKDGNALPEAALTTDSDTRLSFVLGIDAFVQGGGMRWETASSFVSRLIPDAHNSTNSVSTLGWSGTDETTKRYPTINTLAYWNGAYSGTSSNLQYCKDGEIASKDAITDIQNNYVKIKDDDRLTGYLKSTGTMQATQFIIGDTSKNAKATYQYNSSTDCVELVFA